MPDGGLQLEIRQGDGHRRTLALDQSKSIRFGTSALVEVVVSGKGVRPLHCGILWKNDHFELVASTAAKVVEFNGSLVPSAALGVGDRFQVGDVEVIVAERITSAAPAENDPAPSARDEISLAPFDDAPAKKPPPASQPAAKPNPSVKPAAQAKKQSAPPAKLKAPDKLKAPAAPSSSAVIFGDDLADLADLANLSLSEPSAAPLDAFATDPLAAAPAAPPTTGGTPAPQGGFAIGSKSSHGKRKTGTTQGAGKKPSGQRETQIKGSGLIKSPRLWGAVAALAALGLGAYGAVWYSKIPSADEMLASAEQAYESGALGLADERFDAFLVRHAHHPQAHVARVHRALASLRPLADAGGNWPAALSTARESVPPAADALGNPEDRRLLADALAKIAKGLVYAAQSPAAEPSEAAEAAFDRAREAVALGRRWLPDRLRSAAGLDHTELALARLERAHHRQRALNAAIDRINAGDADQARRELFKEYPELATDSRLWAALAESAAAERDRVAFGPFEPPAPAGMDDAPPGGASFARAIGKTAAANGVLSVLAPSSGCAYGIDAASGRLLWRWFVGFDTRFVPRPLDDTPEGDWLLVDSTRSEVIRIRALTGETVWRTPLSSFDAEPVVTADQALVACRDGDLVAIDLANGAARWKCSLPRPLGVGPAVDAARGLIYQLADEGRLYVLSESQRKCIDAIYLGHEAGAVAAPPVLVDHWLLVAADAGLAGATLRVLATDTQPGGVRVVQTLDLSGQVASPLWVHEGGVYVATVGGGLDSFRIGNDAASPLVPGPRRRPDHESQTVGWLSLVGGKLWLAGDGAAVFPLPLDEASLAAPPVAAGQFAQPVVARGESLLLVTYLADGRGVRVRSLPPAAGSSVTWTLDLGTPPAAGPVIDKSGATVSVLDRSGALFRIPIDQFKEVAEFVIIPSAGADASELSRVPLQGTDEGDAVVFDDGLIIFAAARESEALLVFDPTRPRLEHWPLPGKLACRPARFGDKLLLALEHGGVYLVDPRSRELVGEPFCPALEFDALPRWKLATTPDTTQVIVSDGRKVYRLGRDVAPSPRLAVEAEVELESPIGSPLAATATRAAVADAAGRLVLFDLAGLKPQKVALDQAIVWGPRACGDRILVATEAGRLACFVDTEQAAWQVDLHDGLPLSATEDGDALIFTSRRGVVWAVAAATGDALWRREIGQPLRGSVVAVKQGILVAAGDGTLLLLPRGDARAK